MGLLERTRHLLAVDSEPDRFAGIESAETLRQKILAVEALRFDLSSVLADLQRERARLDARRSGTEERMLECEKEIQAALQADDEERARAAIRRKRELASFGSRKVQERSRLDRTIGVVESNLGALELLGDKLRRARHDRMTR